MDKHHETWNRAAIVGSIWASVEIIVGSTLHNLKIPFSGSLLAAVGVILLSAFALRWKTKGMFWRAGLICALMKSISPSAVILGPMTGILMEAILLEFAFRLFGFTLVGVITGGILAVSSALLHKVISLLILYGTDILTIYVNIFHYAAKQLNIHDAGAAELVTIILAGYFILGTTAGIMGYTAGKIATTGPNRPFDKEDMKDFRKQAPVNLKPALGWFFLHLILLPVGLLIINLISLQVFLIIIIPYLSITLVRYRWALQRLTKPSFWSQLLVVAILAALFYRNPTEDWKWVNYQGLITGMEMILRAIFIVIAFRALSVELKHPAIKHFLWKIGFRKTSEMLEISFGMLPLIVQGMPPVRSLFLHPIRSLGALVAMGDEMLNNFRESGENLK